VLLGLVSAGLACLMAMTALERRAPAGRRPLAGVVGVLRRLHSGHLGDYLAWLTVGVALLCAAVAAQT
jgi:multicomponent Na+:H+ antiporter subunit D